MSILVSDFDGTLTRFDFFDLVRQRWPIPPERDPWNRYLAGEITHFQALADIFAGIQASDAELDELTERMELDPDLAEAMERLVQKGWEIVVASAGCDWYIRRLLERAGVNVTVHANPGRLIDGRLMMSRPEGSPFWSESTGVDKIAVVQEALQRSDSVAFAGDGRPDLEPALLVNPTRRFARGWLAEALEERGQKFQSFDRWSDIVPQLTSA